MNYIGHNNEEGAEGGITLVPKQAELGGHLPRLGKALCDFLGAFDQVQ